MPLDKKLELQIALATEVRMFCEEHGLFRRVVWARLQIESEKQENDLLTRREVWEQKVKPNLPRGGKRPRTASVLDDEMPSNEEIEAEEQHEADKVELDPDDVCMGCGEVPDELGACGCDDKSEEEED